MTNVVEFPDKPTLRDDAIAWLMRLDADEPLSPEEEACLGDWLKAKPAHSQELKRLARRWSNMNVLTELAVPLGQLKHQAEQHNRVVGSRSLRYAALAASVVLSVVLGSIYWPSDEPIKETNGQYATAIGEQESTTLNDGSVVLLNTNTQVKVIYTEDYRDIHLLQGQAHFTVAENSDRPFRVFAGGGRIDAVGTAFSVYLKDTSIDVAVTDGQVALASLRMVPDATGSASGSSSTGILTPQEKHLGSLSAGQVATIANATNNPNEPLEELRNLRDLEDQDLSRRLSWTEGLLTFSGDPLEDVVEEIGRYTTVNIEFSDPAVGAIRVGGTFPVGETDTMFRALETTFGLRITYLSEAHVLVSAAN